LHNGGRPAAVAENSALRKSKSARETATNNNLQQHGLVIMQFLFLFKVNENAICRGGAFGPLAAGAGHGHTDTETHHTGPADAAES
jgi:hypothetical protein